MTEEELNVHGGEKKKKMWVIKLKTQVGIDGGEFYVQAKGLEVGRDLRSIGWWYGVGWTGKKVGEDVDPCDISLRPYSMWTPR